MHARRGIFRCLPVNPQQMRRGELVRMGKYGAYKFVDEQTEEILLLFCFISEKSKNQVDGLSADVGEGV